MAVKHRYPSRYQTLIGHHFQKFPFHLSARVREIGFSKLSTLESVIEKLHFAFDPISSEKYGGLTNPKKKWGPKFLRQSASSLLRTQAILEIFGPSRSAIGLRFFSFPMILPAAYQKFT